jgi:hypothetical protein
MKLLAAVASVCLSAGWGAQAEAGPLGKVVAGMKRQSGQSGHRGAAGDPRDGEADDSGSSSASGDTYSSCGTCRNDPTAPIVSHGYHPSYPYGNRSEHFDLYLGLQSVDDSDHAAAFSFRATNGDYGAAFSDTSYFERVPQVSGPDETLRLDVWDVTLQYRLVAADDERTQLWISGGFAGATSEGLEIYGASLGARLTRNLAGELGLEASLRNLRYQDDIAGLEGRVGVAASVVRLSYRYMKFNVGPALEGPEFGIALHF